MANTNIISIENMRNANKTGIPHAQVQHVFVEYGIHSGAYAPGVHYHNNITNFQKTCMSMSPEKRRWFATCLHIDMVKAGKIIEKPDKPNYSRPISRM